MKHKAIGSCLSADIFIPRGFSHALQSKLFFLELNIRWSLYGVQEYGVDIVNDLNSDFAACFVKDKFATHLGETDAVETVRYPTIEGRKEWLSQ